MLRTHMKLFALAALAAVLMLGTPQSASAALQIALQQAGVNGGAITVVASGGNFTSASFDGTYGDFTIKVFGGSSDNGATMSDLLSSTTSVKNDNLLSAGTHTLRLWVTQTDYTLPIGSQLKVESGLGGSLNAGTLTLTNIFQAYADKTNNLFGTTDYTNGLQSATATGTTFDTGSVTGLFTRMGNYSLTSVAIFEMSAGAQANYSDHVNVTPIPEPASMAVWSILGAVCLAYRGRRRNH